MTYPFAKVMMNSSVPAFATSCPSAVFSPPKTILLPFCENSAVNISLPSVFPASTQAAPGACPGYSTSASTGSTSPSKATNIGLKIGFISPHPTIPAPALSIRKNAFPHKRFPAK